MQALERRAASVSKVLNYVGGGFFVAIVLLTVVHVTGRYGFKEPVPGMIDMASTFQIVAVFLLGADVMMENRFVAMDVIIEHFSKRVQAIIDFVTHIVCCLPIAVLACWQTFERSIYIMNSGQEYDSLPLPIFPEYIIASIGWGLLSLAIVIRLAHFAMAGVKK